MGPFLHAGRLSEVVYQKIAIAFSMFRFGVTERRPYEVLYHNIFKMLIGEDFEISL
jgi:hypothetical protein